MGVNVATFLYFLAANINIISLPPHLKNLGLSETAIGYFISLAFFVSLVIRPLSGYLSDRLGYESLMRAGVGVGAFASILYAIGGQDLILVGRMLHGLSVSLFLPISLAASTMEGSRGLAKRGLVIGLANSIGPMTGSLIYDHLGARASFVTASVVLATTVFLVSGAQRTGWSPEGASISKAIDRRLLMFTGLLTIFTSVVASYSSIMPVKLVKSGLPVSYWGVFQSAAAVASLLPRVVLVGVGGSSYGLAALATTTALTGLVLASSSSTMLEMIIAGIVYGVGQGFLVISFLILALDGRPMAGFASSVFTLGWDIGFIVGPPVTGYLVELLGYGVLTWIPVSLAVNIATLVILNFKTARRGS